MESKFMKGCEAIAEAAIRSGCRFFAGYPITPQNEIPEYLSRALPKVGGVFIQGESEVASINMVYGAGGAGTMAMTSSSSPGVSLKLEGVSNLAAARIPAVMVNVMRAGPGMGTIQPAQSDYYLMSKAPGHGGFRTITLAPATLQEAVDLTYEAFELAFRDRMPVIVAPDGFIAAIMEPVDLPDFRDPPETPPWAVAGCGGRDHINVLLNGGVNEEDQLAKNRIAEELYEKWDREDVRVETYRVEDAEYVFAAFGLAARICKSCVDELREEGIKAGLIRPITISPFPYAAFAALEDGTVKYVIDVEMSIPSQMVNDVRLGMKDRFPVAQVNTAGGLILDSEDVMAKVRELAKGV
jgi:2-oxoglutarate ferredoxin oxidoreductase subunit alpha